MNAVPPSSLTPGIDTPDRRGRTGLDRHGRDLTGNPHVRITDVEVLACDWYVLRKTTFDYRHTDGHWSSEQRETYDRGDGATILLYDTDRRTVLLTRQFRLPAYVNGHPDGMLIEAAAGLLDGDSPEEAIRREATEETGHDVGSPEHVFDVYMSPGSVTERLHFFAAPYGSTTATGEGGGIAAEGEDIAAVELPFDKALAMIRSGEIADAKTVMLLQWAALDGPFRRAEPRTAVVETGETFAVAAEAEAEAESHATAAPTETVRPPATARPTPHLWWPHRESTDLLDGVHRVVTAVVRANEAVGWLTPPGRAECAEWLGALLGQVSAGDAALCVASVADRIEAIGVWRRDQEGILRHRGEIGKVMSHPEARGQGLGRAVAEALIGNAHEAGLEHLRLRIRGNNHGALALYESLGFREYARLPNAIAVGDQRFDEVWAYLPLQQPPGVVHVGADATGPGASTLR